MTDITKCEGTECPRRETCYRYTAPESRAQSWFMKPPYKDGKCEMYWPEKAKAADIVKQHCKLKTET